MLSKIAHFITRSSLRKMLSSGKMNDKPKPKKRFSIIFNCILWFYRIIGFSFGGIAIDSDGRLHIKKAFVIYDYFLRLFLPLLALLISLRNLYSSRFNSLHHGTNDAALYATLLNIILNNLTSLNTCWMIGRGSKAFVKSLSLLGTHVTTGTKVLLALWIVHLVIPIPFVVVGMSQSDMFQKESTFAAIVYIWATKFIFFYQVWMLTFITLFVSQQCHIWLRRIMSDLEGFHLNKHGESKPSMSYSGNANKR